MAAVSLLLAGCSVSAPPVSTATPRPTLTAGAGFYDPQSPPAPESTVTPNDSAWAGVHPPAGYSVVLLSYAGDEQHADVLIDSIESWAAEENVTLTPMVAKTHDDLVDTTLEAIELKPDLIISAGDVMVDPLAAVTAGYLAQQFLIVGAEIAEPTNNVTSVDWTGAGFRGEGLGTPTTYDPASFTTERADRAVRAGVAAVIKGARGFVIWIS